MSKPFVVSIPHRLGRDEAVRRLKSGLGTAQANYKHLFTVEEETWTGDRLQFRIAMAAGETRRSHSAAGAQGRHAVT
jgi:hypothetical protein